MPSPAPAPRTFDLAVIGAGSAGIGAALAAARLGLSVALVDSAPAIGGTTTRGGVSVWAACVGGTGIPFDIYRALKAVPGAVCITSYGRHGLWPQSGEPKYPGGESVPDPAMRYHNSLRRHGSRGMKNDAAFVREHWHNVLFEPAAYTHVVTEMLNRTGRCHIFLNSPCTDVHMRGPRVESVTIGDGTTLAAHTFVDATGDAVLARLCGVPADIGQDARARYNESGAPEEANAHVNSSTLVFRATPADTPGIEPLPDGIPAECWWASRFPSVSVDVYPNGDLILNMLPTVTGAELMDMGYEAALAEARRRVLAQWHHLQTVFPEFQKLRLLWIAPALGVRESYRVRAETMLTQHDLLQGVNRQTHADIIALADHAMDTHGQSTGRAGCGELEQPYGIPFRSLLPVGTENLMVAGRCAGFSSIAASSCRTQRAMMHLGQAAGTAAYLANDLPTPLRQIPPRTLRQSLRQQHVQLEWPMEKEIEEHVLGDG